MGDNIKLDHKEIGCEDVDWSHVTQDRESWWVVTKMVMDLQAE
jgi:hypothetical protein